MDVLNDLQRVTVLAQPTVVCMYCGMIRRKKRWLRAEPPVKTSSRQFLSHSACPKCLLEALPALVDEIRQELGNSPEAK